MTKVSVIIPAYNAMAYLPETVASVLGQTLKDFELIIVNDGSSDDVETWFSQLTDPRVRLISQSNQGLACARNTGIANTQGEYIAFLDADDLWEPTKLEKQLQLMEQNPAVGLAYTWVAYIDETGKSTGRVFSHQADGQVWEQLIQHNIVECGSVAMVRRTCFDQVGVFDSQLTSFNVNEDWDMWLRIAAKYPFGVIKEPLVLYRQHSNGASKNWNAMEQSFQIVIEKAFASAAPQQLHLKRKSYAAANLCLAWKPLQCRDKDYRKSQYFRQQAVYHYPAVRFSVEYLRLSLAIAIMRWLGPNGYKQFLLLFYEMRRQTSATGK